MICFSFPFLESFARAFRYPDLSIFIDNAMAGVKFHYSHVYSSAQLLVATARSKGSITNKRPQNFDRSLFQHTGCLIKIVYFSRNSRFAKVGCTGPYKKHLALMG